MLSQSSQLRKDKKYEIRQASTSRPTHGRPRVLLPIKVYNKFEQCFLLFFDEKFKIYNFPEKGLTFKFSMSTCQPSRKSCLNEDFLTHVSSFCLTVGADGDKSFSHKIISKLFIEVKSSFRAQERDLKRHVGFTSIPTWDLWVRPSYWRAPAHHCPRTIVARGTPGNMARCINSSGIRDSDILSCVLGFFREHQSYSSRSCSRALDRDGALDNGWNVLLSQKTSRFLLMPDMEEKNVRL